MHTIGHVLTEAAAVLEAAGVEAPRLDAELLLAHVLGHNRTYLFAHRVDPLPDAARLQFEALASRRAGREPLPYILGVWEWLGMPFRVGPGVLIPRPETETLVEEAARRLPPDARVLDVGTGSGCIAVGLTTLLPDARVTALEPSPEAAAIAAENIARLAPEGRVTLVEAAFPPMLRGASLFEGIVSNPPYISSAEVQGLPPELRLFEPRAALDGGEDGLDVLRSLAAEGPRFLVPGGLLAVEVAQNQARTFAALLPKRGWEGVEIVPDLAGVERIVLARRAQRPKKCPSGAVS